jgi:predicted outer membrane protein
MAKKSKASDAGTPATERQDGRVAFFTYMKPDLKEAVKRAAADEGLKAWQWLERAAQKALKGKRKG